MAEDQAPEAAREEAARGRMTRLREAAVRVDSHPVVLGAVELLRAVGDAVEDTFFAAGGTIVKRLGDGVMAVFDDPQAALGAALDAQTALEGVAVEGHRPRMRVGVHHGCPRKVGGDYLGVDVNIAARVAEQAGAGEVLVSEPTWEHFDHDGLAAGRAKRLKADGAPREMRVRTVSRARD